MPDPSVDRRREEDEDEGILQSDDDDDGGFIVDEEGKPIQSANKKRHRIFDDA